MARCFRSACRGWRPALLVRHARLGVRFGEKWYCSTRCLELEAQGVLSEARHHDGWVMPPRSAPVGRLLVQRQAVTRELVEVALRSQRQTGRRLGAELVAMRATTQEDVLRALAAQAGVGCLPALDVARVAEGPGGLAQETVQLLRVVPFDASHRLQRLSVACASPLPGSALSAVREMTGWQVQPFLVPDELLQGLIDAYACARLGPPLRQPIRSLPEAAATIARAAEAGVARRMQHVRCDSFVWVRLEGEAHAEDLMVALEHPQEDTTWQAAPTPH